MMKQSQNDSACSRLRAPLNMALTGAALAFLALPALGQDAEPQEESATAATSTATPAETEPTLGTVVVTASSLTQALADAPATISVIDGSEIVSRPYATVADALKNLPGVIVNAPSGRSGSRTVSIRGLDEDYVLLLVDGKPLGNSREATYNGFGAGLALSYLPPPSSIARIEVIRGPMSSLYGSSALGGVINIITKPVGDVWSGTATLGASQYGDSSAGDAKEGRFYLNGPLLNDRLGLALYGSRHVRHKDEVTVAGRGGEYLQSEKVTRSALGARLTAKLSDAQTLKLETNHNAQDSATRRLDNGQSSGIEAKHRNHSLAHNIVWGPRRDTDSFIALEDTDFVNSNLVSGYKMLNFNTKTRLGFGSHDLVVGADWRDETTRHAPSRVNVAPTMSRWQWALFAEDNVKLTRDLTLTAGLRYDNNQRYGSHLTPRAYAIWRASPSVTLKGGVSGGYKTPSLKQADSNIFEPSGGDGRARDQGNTSLKPEESTNFEIGAVWEAARGVQLGVTAYRTRFKNKITTEQICAHDTPVPGLPSQCGMNSPTNPIKWINQYVNRDAAQLNGLEATLDFNIGDVLVGMNYTYAKSEITRGRGLGEPFNDNPRHVANLKLDWQASRQLTAWSTTQYRSSTLNQNRGYIDNHVIFDVGLDYQFTDALKGSVAIYNVGDKTFGNTGYNDGRMVYVALTGTF